MGRTKRAAAFVVAAARKLAEEDPSVAAKMPGPLLQQAIGDLPQGKLRLALEADLPRFVALFAETVKEAVDSDRHEAPPVENLLEFSVVSGREYGKSIEAVVSAVEDLDRCGGDIERLIASCRRLLGCRPDASLALWWTYAALELQNLALDRDPGKKNEDLEKNQDRNQVEEQKVIRIVSAAKALMHRLRGLTMDPFAAVAAMAPVIAALYEAGSILAGLKSSRSKPGKNAVKMLESASKEVLGSVAMYTSRQRGNPPNQGSRNRDLSSRGLVLAGRALSKVTGIDRVDDEVVARLFPLSSKSMKKSLLRECGDAEVCASIVAAEALLLRISASILESKGNLENHDLREKLKFLVVHGADMLVDLLLDPVLSVEHILSTEEELFLRGILYDVVLADRPKLHDLHLQGEPEFSLFLKKIGLAQRAIQFYRSQGDRTKAVDLSSRLPLWSLPKGFSQWLQSDKIMEKPSGQTLSDSRALIGWLTSLGEDGIAAILANAAAPRRSSKKRIEQDPVRSVAEELDAFFVDTKGDFNPEELDADKAFAIAADSMKEEEARNEEGEESASDQSDEDDNVVDHEVNGDDFGKTDDEEKDDKVEPEGQGIVDCLQDDMDAVLSSEAATEPTNETADEATLTLTEAPVADLAKMEAAEPDPAPEQNVEQTFGDHHEEPNIPATPRTPRPRKTPRTPAAPLSLPIDRCTRSGKKYFVEQSVPAASKRRKVTKDGAATAADAAADLES